MTKELGNLNSNKRFLDIVERNWKGKKVLEIGCGNGSLTNYLYKQGAEIKAVDIREIFINNAKKRFPSIPRETFSVMKGEELKFKDNQFDYVLSFDVLEHIEDTDKHLQEVYRVLKSGGVYALGTPNKITNIPWEIIAQKSLTKWKTYHCSLHTYRQLKRRMNDNNFGCEFVDIPIMNDFVREKLFSKTGFLGKVLIKIIDIDKLPTPLRTNFYVISKKIERGI